MTQQIETVLEVKSKTVSKISSNSLKKILVGIMREKCEMVKKRAMVLSC